MEQCTMQSRNFGCVLLGQMEQHALKNVNSCQNTKISTSGGYNFNTCLMVVYILNWDFLKLQLLSNNRFFCLVRISQSKLGSIVTDFQVQKAKQVI